MPRSASDVLQSEYLVARSKILELAATLDRLDRCSGSVDDHPQKKLLIEGIQILLSTTTNRAEQLQVLMSRPYDPQWRQNLGVPSPSST